jgi:hypothetical protein
MGFIYSDDIDKDIHLRQNIKKKKSKILNNIE